MFCQYCGNPLDDGARFCKSCGKPVPASVASGPRIVAADPAQVFRHHVRVLGIVWLVYGVFGIIMSIWILVFSHYFLPTMQDIVSRGNTPFPFPIVQFLHAIYAISSAYGAATGILGIIAGAMLLQKARRANARHRRSFPQRAQLPHRDCRRRVHAHYPDAPRRRSQLPATRFGSLKRTRTARKNIRRGRL